MAAASKVSAKAKAKAKAVGKRSAGRPKTGKVTVGGKPQKAKGVKLAKTKEALFQKGRVDRDFLKASTKMTKEQWQKHQVGMDDKWPLPDYMNGEKGHMSFKGETYMAVSCWTAETQIEYRPHAKAPGSKSHLRYEKYAKAKTVGEALKFGSYPHDWCWDLERGFLRMKKDGPFRDEPLGDISKGDDVSPVDKAIYFWYMRELAKMLGMKASELKASAGFGETFHIRAMRLMAQREASEYLEAADREGRAITDNEVLLTLKRWPFNKNPYRKNVMQEGKKWVYSDSLGALRDRTGDVHLTVSTRRYPQVAEIFSRWLADRLPPDAKSFTWTTINVNCNYAAATHRDNGNFGPSFIKAFGEFTGGELNYWPNDAGGDVKALPASGSTALDIQKNLLLFNGNCAHNVAAFEGSRYSLVFFTMGCHAGIKSGDRTKLQKMSFAIPAHDEDPFTLLRPPKSYQAKHKDKVISKKTLALPGMRVYEPKAFKLVKKKPKTAVEIKKIVAARVEPENARSFYSNEARRAARDEAEDVMED